MGTFQQMIWGQLDIIWKKNLDFYLIPFNKINAKWITDLDVTAKAIKLLEVNIQANLRDLRFSDSFLNMTPKAQVTTVIK